MRIIYKSCLGLDLHKKGIAAHLRVQRRMNGKIEGTDLTFGTMPDELMSLRQFIVDHRVERNDLSDKLAPRRLCVRRGRGQCQCGAESARDFGRQACKQSCEPPRSMKRPSSTTSCVSEPSGL